MGTASANHHGDRNTFETARNEPKPWFDESEGNDWEASMLIRSTEDDIAWFEATA